MRSLACLLAELAAGLGELDDAAPAVFRLGNAPDRAQRFKLVEHVDHDAGRHADPAGDLELGQLARLGEFEHGTVTGLDPETGQPLGEPAACDAAEFAEQEGEAGRHYESVRTVVLVGAAIWLLLRRRRHPLRLALILNALTQFGDAVIGLAVRHSTPGTLGPACFAAALAYAAWRLGRVASLTL
jgi:hypothetical protein